MKVVSRKNAKAGGLKRYFTGKPCKHRHVAEKLVSNYACVICHVNKVNAWRVVNAEKQKKTYAIWWVKNKQKKNAQSLAWSRNNEQRHKNNAKKWRQRRPDMRRANERNRRAREKHAEGRHTARDVAQLFADQGGLCLCGTTLFKYHVDHKTPLSRGGSNWSSNLQLLCGPCNNSKGNKIMNTEWRATTAS